MGPFAVLALITGGLMLSVFSDTDTDTDTPTDTPDTPTDPTGPSEILVGDADVVGTQGDDVIRLAPADDSGVRVVDVNVDGGAGDDTIELGATGLNFVGEIDGGSGDDSIHLEGDGPTAHGGTGDDMISGSSFGDRVFLYGDAGNDTLEGSVNAYLDGGEGDDLLIASGVWDNGAAFGVIGTGGDGDDTLRIDATRPFYEYNEGSTFSGGTGADTFEVTVDEYTTAINSETDGDFEGVGNVITNTVLRIDDFEAGVDQLVIEATTSNDGYSLTTAQLVGAQVVLRYEPDDLALAVREVIVSLEGAQDVTWDDISFTGDLMPELQTADTTLAVTSDAPSVVGTAGDDFVRTSGTNGTVEFSVDAQDGDDTIALDGPLGAGTVSAGAGDDLVSAEFISATHISGDAGDDTIEASGSNSTIHGGEGGDLLSVGDYFTDGEVHGDAGDDTLVAYSRFYSSGIDGILDGGAGDDLIILKGARAVYATSDALIAQGGLGNDTIDVDARGPLLGDANSNVEVAGGDGADLFNVRLDERVTYEDEDETADVIPVLGLTVSDFETGSDTLNIDLASDNPSNFTLLNARLEDDGAGGTNLVMRYLNDDADGPDRDVSIALLDAEVSWTDISFTGGPTPTLLAQSA